MHDERKPIVPHTHVMAASAERDASGKESDGGAR